MTDIFSSLPEFAPGWVWIAGAGPGDVGLLTLLALHGLNNADCIVFDALVSEEVLVLAAPHAEMIPAGKRGGRPSAKQDDISDRLISLAKDGKRVLRLKGGDPMVFGRGGEEAAGLASAGVPFRIIPGISAGIGGLAYAGIPVTHRNINSAVTFLTGHDSTGEVPDSVDWESVSRGSKVLVVYMALLNIKKITERLQSVGRDSDEPVAIVSRASMKDQQVLISTLGACASDVASSALEPPAILVVGKAVEYHQSLNWFPADSTA